MGSKKLYVYKQPPILPSQQDLGKILQKADNARAKAVIALMAFSGLGLATIRKLRITNMPDLVVGSTTIDFTKMPAKIIWSSPIFEPPIPTFFTFLCGQGCDYLREYLKERLRNSDKLIPFSHVIRNSDLSELRRSIRQPIVNAGFDFTPHDFCRYFAKQMGSAEEAGSIDGDYRRFFMGHFMSEAQRKRNVRMKKLPASLESTMRKGYDETASKYLVV